MAGRILIMTLALLVGMVPAAYATGIETAEQAGDVSQLVGVWILNRDLSTAPGRGGSAPTPGVGGGRRPGSGGSGGRGGFPGGGRRGAGSGTPRLDPERMQAMQTVMRDLMETSEKLNIVMQDDTVIITSADGRVQRLKADGRRVEQKAANGLVSLTRRTRWDDNALVTEVELENGPKIVQTYTRSEGGSQLLITVKLERPRGEQPIEIKRVYDPDDVDRP